MGRTLFLLRHAKSSWDDPTLPDHDRPLTRRGRRACELIADYLRHAGITPTVVLCSSSTRTRETLERIALGFEAGAEVQVEEELYGASAEDLLTRLRGIRSSAASVMVIGHHPAIQELALDLASGGARLEALQEKFPTGALATLAVQGDWAALAPGTAELVAFVKPRELQSKR